MTPNPPFLSSLIKVELGDGLATVTINRPDDLNMLNPAVVHQMHRAFEQVAADLQVEGIVISGEGKAFVAGADIAFFLRNIEAGNFERLVKFTEAVHKLFHTIERCPKPVVARLGGVAFGGGLELALACGCVIASPRADLAFSETSLGIYPDFGGTQRTPRAIGIGLAKWLIFTGTVLSAPEARAIGLIDRVVPHEELEDAARRSARGVLPAEQPVPRPPEFDVLARFFESHSVEELRAAKADTKGNPLLDRAMKRVAANAPIALRHAERMIDEGMRRSLEEGLQMEIDHTAESLSAEDAYTGLTFRAQKRLGKPVFRGR